MKTRVSASFALFLLLVMVLDHLSGTSAAEPSRTYRNEITPIPNPKPLLADHADFVEPVREMRRFEAPALVDEPEADLRVRAWRFSYNARGIIEMPNNLRATNTALIMVHPWGTDDGQGWNTPEPAGAADRKSVV